MRTLIVCILMIITTFTAYAENAYERITRTNEIRCGYVIWPGNFDVDANTGKFSGIAYDIAQAMAKELGYTIKWVEEVGWGTYAEGLNTNRYDLMCAPVWKSGQRAKISLLTRTLFYENMYGMVREDDNRFDQDINNANNENITIAVIDGDITQQIRKTLFTKSNELALSPISGSSPNVISVVTGKADLTMTNLKVLQNYNANNDKKLKLADNGKPIRQFPSAFAMKIGDHDLKALLDSTIETLQTSGEFDTIINKNKADLTSYKTNNM